MAPTCLVAGRGGSLATGRRGAFHFFGKRLVPTLSQSQNVYGFTKGQSIGAALRPLLAPKEIMLQFAQGKMLVLPQGPRPVVTQRVAYFNDQSLAGLWDDPRTT